jgi:hypothetical protein
MLIFHQGELIGFCFRIYGHYNPDSVSGFAIAAYIIQTCFILLAPVLFTATIYMFLSRIIIASDHSSLSLIRPSRLTKIFVWGDLICLSVQGNGSGELAKTDKNAPVRAKAIILTGLFMQIILFVFFVTVARIFQDRVNKLGTGAKVETGWPWQRWMAMLYGVSILITVRNIFRVVEYAMGGKTPRLRPLIMRLENITV